MVALGPEQVADTSDPLARAVANGSWSWLAPVVRVGAAVAALGSLLALVLGVSRTAFAMARDGHLPRALNAVHPRFGVPHRAEIAVGVVVLVSVVDLRMAIGFSSFAVLVYYAIANASAWTLYPNSGDPNAGRPAHDHRRRIVPGLGLVGCLVLAAHLPTESVITGAAVLALGAVGWAVRRSVRRSGRRS